MKKQLVCLLLGSLLVGGVRPLAIGQAADKLIFGGLNGLIGVGRYNAVNYGVGVSGRFHYPFAPKIALTAKVGLEMYRIAYTYLIPMSYLGYGYNAITGFGFNTIYYNWGYGYEGNVTGINIPISFGPRYYVTDQLHADLNVGVDIAANQNMVSVLRLEPSLGYTFPLNNGGFADLNAGYFTSFARGSGMFTIGLTYGLKLN